MDHLIPAYNVYQLPNGSWTSSKALYEEARGRKPRHYYNPNQSAEHALNHRGRLVNRSLEAFPPARVAPGRLQFSRDQYRPAD